MGNHPSQISPDLLKKSQCAKCKNLLAPPVWIVTVDTNYCDHCYRQEPNTAAVRCSLLEAYFNHFLYPCKNSKQGCTELIKQTEFEFHHENCEYNFRCPFTVYKRCSTTGVTKLLFNRHLQEHHAASIKFSPSYTISLETIALGTKKVRLRLLKLDGVIYILKVVHQMYNKVKIGLYHTEVEHSKVYFAKAKLDNEKLYLPVNWLDDFSLDDCEHETEIHSFHFTNYLDLEIIYPIKHWISKSKLDVRVRKHLQCFVCGYELTSLNVCDLGHNICNACKSGFSCPICDSEYNYGQTVEEELIETQIEEENNLFIIIFLYIYISIYYFVGKLNIWR